MLWRRSVPADKAVVCSGLLISTTLAHTPMGPWAAAQCDCDGSDGGVVASGGGPHESQDVESSQ
jgi:hypothetical protein